MRAKWLGIATLIILTGGCQGDGSAANNAAAAAEAENLQALENRLDASFAPLRAEVFGMAIRQAGHECAGIDNSASHGAYQGSEVFTAHCSGGGSWVILIGQDDSHRVMDEGEARRTGVLR
jgi:hypothetical protein